jgi:hypothetical protein
MPTIAFIGVRISWLMVARKSLLARFAELGRLLRRHQRSFSLKPLFRFVGQGHQIPDGRGELYFFSRPLTGQADPLMTDHAGQSAAEENGHVQQ